MSDPRELVADYYTACNAADVERIVAALDDRMTHYFLAPNHGDDLLSDPREVAEATRGAVEQAGASWTIDRSITDGRTVVVEWTMPLAPDHQQILSRGCEWIEVSHGRLTELRGYLQTGHPVTELDGFPYAERKYGTPRDSADVKVAGEPGVASREQGLAWLPLIADYYEACTAADAERLAGCFTEDVVHYFMKPNVGSAPVRGRAHLARYWRKVARMIEAHWVVESIVEQGDEAVIEWSMYWVPAGGSERIVTRGTEWYVFRNGLIAEIRSYHKQLEQSTELKGFPYAARGYSTLAHEASTLHP